MNKSSKKIIALLIIFLTFSQSQVISQSRERSDIPTEYKWKLEDLYESQQAWNEAKEKIVSQFDEVEKFKGKLASSAAELLACLEFNSELSKEFGRLYSYASMKSDEDTRDSKHLAMEQELQQLSTDYSSKASFITPEIVQMDKETIDAFMEDESGLKIYKMPLYDVLRTKAHTLSEKEEKILAETGLLSDGPSTIYSIFSNAELPYPEITLSDGNSVTLTKAAYAMHRASTIRHPESGIWYPAIDSHALATRPSSLGSLFIEH